MAKILLFGVSTQKDRAVRVAAEKIGVDVTAVNRRDYGQKIGTLAEISGFHKNGKIYNGPDFAMEMLVFSGMDSQQVDAFLAEYKATGLPPVALKAIVTPYKCLMDSGCVASRADEGTHSAWRIGNKENYSL